MYKLVLSRQADKFLEKHKELEKIIIEIFTDIINSPYITISRYDIRKLSGSKDTYRLRAGKYRAIFEIRNKELLIYVIKVDNRGEVYKN